MLDNNTLIITSDNIKKDILKNNNKLLNIKIMSLEEFYKKITFNYDKKTIYYLMNNYSLKYEVAIMYLENLYYIENKKYNNDKLTKLVALKKYLEKNDLLIKNSLFKESLNDKKIVVYGYEYIPSHIKKELNNYHIEYKDNELNIYNNQLLYEFNTKEEEIEFVASKIIELVNNGVSLNKIKIVKPSIEYLNIIKRIFKIYNINIDQKTNLYSTDIAKIFINKIKLNEDLDGIKKEIDLNNKYNLIIYNKIISILNSYTFNSNYQDILQMLIYDFKNSYIVKEEYKNKIEFINLENDIISPDNYVFLLGFNVGNIPYIKKDEDYLSDNIKQELNLDTSKIINKKIKNILLDKIKSINNLIITYKVKEDKEYYISTLNEELKLNIIKDYKIPYYNDLLNKIKLTKKLDLLNKYNEKEEDIDLLYNNYKDINYRLYDNRFTGIDKKEFKKYMNNKLLLSYSSVNNYFKCGFKYYIENILKLTPHEENFIIIIGNLFHHILEYAFKNNFNLDEEYNKYLKELNKEFTKKEIFFLNKLKLELKIIIDTIKKQYKHISLDKTLYEEKIYVSKNTNITFMGVIDKLMYKQEDDKTYIAIIDYKTGDTNLNLNNIIYGIDMQLPIYLYLSKKTKKLKNVEVIGFYIQKILNNEITINHKDTYLKQKENNLKLQGYSINNEQLLEKFDNTYINSEIIKSMKVGKNGFYSYSKVLTKETLSLIDNLVDKKIDEAINSIINADFKINPKKIGNNNVSCTFCKYKDICYKNDKDIVNLKEYKNLEFINNCKNDKNIVYL